MNLSGTIRFLLPILLFCIFPCKLESRSVDWNHYEVRLGQEDLKINLPPDWHPENNTLTEFVAVNEKLKIYFTHAFDCNKELTRAPKKLAEYVAVRRSERNVDEVSDSQLSTYKARQIKYRPGWSWSGKVIEGWREVEIIDGFGHSLRLSGMDKDINGFLADFREVAREVVVYDLCGIR